MLSLGRGRQAGFMLVAVMVLVLTLTVLGLSLLALGSYEAGYVGAELRRARAYFAARAGLVRAQAVLQSTESLDLVRADLPTGVARLVALQNGDSTGTVDWQAASPVAAAQRIKVTSVGLAGGARRELSMWFEPIRVGGQSLHAITNRGAMTIGSGTVTLNGSVRQSSNDLTWLQNVLGNPKVTIAEIQAPDVAGFVAAHTGGEGGSILLAAEPSGNYSMSEGFYYSSGQTPDWSFYDTSNSPEVEVDGTVVWVADHGLKFEKPVEIRKASGGGPESKLVIVSRRGGANPADYGVRFYSGIRSTNVPVVIVTDGRVMLGDPLTTPPQATLQNLAILADGVFLKNVRLDYDAPTMDGLILQLQASGSYPGPKAGVFGVLSPVPAGWSDDTYPLD